MLTAKEQSHSHMVHGGALHPVRCLVGKQVPSWQSTVYDGCQIEEECAQRVACNRDSRHKLRLRSLRADMCIVDVDFLCKQTGGLCRS